jgi:hypothetical protein
LRNGLQTDFHVQAIQNAMARYFVLDALICNTDRHHENWGFLMTYQPVDSENVNDQLKMAPSFDHASSLGRELLPKRANEILSANGSAWSSISRIGLLQTPKWRAVCLRQRATLEGTL